MKSRLLFTFGDGENENIKFLLSEFNLDTPQDLLRYLITKVAEDRRGVVSRTGVSREPKAPRVSIVERRRQEAERILTLPDQECADFIKSTGFLRGYAFQPANADKITCTVRTLDNYRKCTIHQDGGLNTDDDLKAIVDLMMKGKFIKV